VNVRFGVLTDLHRVQDSSRTASWHNAYDFAGVLPRCREALALFETERVDHVLVLGDVAHDGDLASVHDVIEIVSARPAALAVGGNHDSAEPTRRLAEAAGDSLGLPGWRAVRRGAVKVAGVRVVRRSQGGWRAARPPALRTWGDSPVLLASHFPVVSRAATLAERRLPYAGDLVGRAALEKVLVGRSAATVVACGHLHVRDSSASGSLLQLGFGALVEPPFEATILDLTVEGSALAVSRAAHELGRAPEQRDPRLVPARERWRHTPGRGWRRDS
jgi:Calcineurin-like phosphoesterase superfamily domain